MSRNSESRVPPSNLPAEESLLGAMLLSSDAQDDVFSLGVASTDFYRPAHQLIFAAMELLNSVLAPIDVVTVSDELRRRVQLDEIGGAERLLELQNATPAISNARRYAKIVQENALLREAISAAAEIADGAYDNPDDVEQYLERARARMSEVQATGGQSANMDGYYPTITDMPHSPAGEWVGEGLVCKGEVLTCTAGGGLGKSTLGRWFAYAIANGLDPWFGNISPYGMANTLIVDCETQPWNIKESGGIFLNKIGRLLAVDPDEVYEPAIIARRARFDLRKRPNRATLREALRRTRPSFVVMGPLKNLVAEEGSESYAQSALEVQDILMSLMDEFGFGLYLEAHGSKGASHHTAGSQRWNDWPDMAIGLELVDEETVTKDSKVNDLITEFCRNRGAGEIALRVTRNREPRNSGMIVPKLLIRSPHRALPFTVTG